MKKKDLECKAFYPSLEEPYKSLFEECQYPWEALPKCVSGREYRYYGRL